MSDRSEEAIANLVERLLDDPLIGLVMRADRVDRNEARALFHLVALSIEIHSGVSNESQEGAMTVSSAETPGFRQGVGIVLLNSSGRIFVGERIDTPGAWQMPQGGIDEGEASQAAALRELREEIGTDQVEVLGESRDWLRYELPSEIINSSWDGRWRGQRQKWFAMLFKGQDGDINIATDHPEFSAWRWATFHEAVELIAPFKRRVYEQVAHEFAGLAARRISRTSPGIAEDFSGSEPSVAPRD